MKGTKIQMIPNSFTRFSVTIKENPVVNLSPGALFKKHQLEAQIEHECGVHLKRFFGGKKKGWYILSRGTWYYQSHEEGLAIYQAEQVMKKYIPEFENQTIYKNYYLIDQAQTHDFQQMVGIVSQMKFSANALSWFTAGFNKVLKLKRGIKDTKVIHPWTVYFRSKTYLDWYLKLKKWLDEWGDIEKLMVGKVKLEDLEFIY